MDTATESLIIRKEPKTGLMESLVCYRKQDLLEMGDFIQLRLFKSHTKAQQAEMLKEAIMEYKNDWSARLTEEEQEQLERLADGKQPKSQDPDQSFGTLVRRGIVFLFRHDGELYSVVPEELRETVEVSGGVKGVSETGSASASPEPAGTHSEKQGYALLMQMGQNMERIFGRLDYGHLSSVWNRHHEEKLTTEDVKRIVGKQ